MIAKTHPKREEPGTTEGRLRSLAAPPWTLVLEAEPLTSVDEEGCATVDLGYPILDSGGAALAYVMIYPGEESAALVGRSLAAGALMAEAPEIRNVCAKAEDEVRNVARSLSRVSAASNRDARDQMLEALEARLRSVAQDLRMAASPYVPETIAAMAGVEDGEPPTFRTGTALPATQAQPPERPPARGSVAGKRPRHAELPALLRRVAAICHPCDGGGVHSDPNPSTCEVRTLPGMTGGLTQDLLMCRACFDHEMAYREARNRDLADPNAYGVLAWESLEIWRADDEAIS